MYAYIEERVLSLAEYIIEHESTVRAAAREFGISKSTVHQDMQTRLRQLDPMLAKEVRAILKKARLLNRAIFLCEQKADDRDGND